MPLITLPAHFDGDKICLDEPYALRPNIRLMVVVLSDRQDDKAPSGVRLGELPEILKSLPHLSQTEMIEFEKDIYEIRTQTLSDYAD
jgi:hypothetical protein